MAEMLQNMREYRRCVAAGFEADQPPPVFSGDLDTPRLMIGQAPDLTGYKQHSPFVGPSGKRHFSWLQQAGLDESCGKKFPSSFNVSYVTWESALMEMATVVPHPSNWSAIMLT